MYPPNMPRPDDNDVKRVATVATHLGPGAAHPSAEHVMGERGLLNVNEIVRIWVKAGQHGRLLQTPPDLVVKFQCLDIVDVILRLVLRPRVVYQREIKG